MNWLTLQEINEGCEETYYAYLEDEEAGAQVMDIHRLRPLHDHFLLSDTDIQSLGVRIFIFDELCTMMVLRLSVTLHNVEKPCKAHIAR
jgi:hypothetical protein